MHIDIALGALLNLLTDPYLIGLMFVAVPLGAFFGAMPGLGGKLGVVLLIPFVFGMDPIPGAVLLLAMHAVVHTGGSIRDDESVAAANRLGVSLVVTGVRHFRH